MNIQSYYQKALKFAAQKHAAQNQMLPGTNLPYVVHLSNVAMEILMAAQNSTEFNAVFAVQVALLHDTIEDTSTTPDEIAEVFDPSIAAAVSALTKNDTLPKNEKMSDSLTRIKKLEKEVWAVKLADRITNLQQPPSHWDDQKIKGYKKEALTILENLRGGNTYLEKRLEAKISEYEKYIV
jgi:guanosine-3',5'-bis(diphosphate) 3'-pyrophosphohydrolase